MRTRLRRTPVAIVLAAAVVFTGTGAVAAPASAAPHAVAACASPSATFADWWTDEGWPRTGSNKEYQTTDPSDGDTVWIWGGETYRNDSSPELPSGTYNSYDADFLTSKGENRGADRLVRDTNTHETYYTDDHYGSWCDMGTT
jgi:hypothetical protein